MDNSTAQIYVIDNDPKVDWPVIVKLPADGGTFEEYQFTATIKVLSPSEFESLSSASPVTMPEILKDNAEQFAKLVVDWKGPTDTNGNAVPFTPETLAAQITGPRGAELSAGLWTAIREIRTGARLGNSAPLSVAG